ncbi:hypothetical protein, partial [Rhodococcus aerolatus]
VTAAQVADPATTRALAGLAAGPAASLLVGRTVIGGVVVAVAATAGPAGPPGEDPADRRGGGDDPPQWPWSPRAHTPGSTVPGATAGRDDHPGGRVNTT